MRDKKVLDIILRRDKKKHAEALKDGQAEGSSPKAGSVQE